MQLVPVENTEIEEIKSKDSFKGDLSNYHFLNTGKSLNLDLNPEVESITPGTETLEEFLYND